MGLYTLNQDRFYLATKYQIWQFDNNLQPNQTYKIYDKLYIPRKSFTTGDLDIHDLAVDHNGNLIFVNTLFSCLATISDRHSFKPLWKPAFISKLAAEDRCHLNGLAMKEGKASYVTAVSQADMTDGWRDNRQKGLTVDYQFLTRAKDRKKIRLGIFSLHLKPHPETLATFPIFEYLNRNEFEIIIYLTSIDNSSLEKYYANKVDKFVLLPNNLKNAVNTIRQDDLDIFWIGTNVSSRNEK